MRSASAAGLQALLHRAQVEEQLALGLGGGHLDHAPVLQDVFVDFGLDPVHRVADQAHALVGVEALDGLHQADVAFLDQVALGQAIAKVLARDRHHKRRCDNTRRPAASRSPWSRRLRAAADSSSAVSGGRAVHGRDVRVQVAAAAPKAHGSRTVSAEVTVAADHDGFPRRHGGTTRDEAILALDCSGC